MALLEFPIIDNSIGLNGRATRLGPEADLTNEFLLQIRNEFNTKNGDYALFYEPLMPTGFPDIVIAEFRKATFDGWTELRSSLQVFDFKILHHLYFIQQASSEDMESQLSIDSKILIRSLERLLDAGLIKRSSRSWRPKCIYSSYGIKKLITIEAKIKDWDGALKQASLNRWFASESYVLLPSSKIHSSKIELAQNLGIGIYISPKGRRFKKVSHAYKGPLPGSYASWFFNEWIGRKLFLG